MEEQSKITVSLGQFYKWANDKGILYSLCEPIWKMYDKESAKKGLNYLCLDDPFIIKILSLDDFTSNDAKFRPFQSKILEIILNEESIQYKCCLIDVINYFVKLAKIDEFGIHSSKHGTTYQSHENKCWKNWAETMLAYCNSIILPMRLDSVTINVVSRLLYNEISVFDFADPNESNKQIFKHFNIESDDCNIFDFVGGIPGLSIKELARIVFQYRKPKNTSLKCKEKQMNNNETKRAILPLIGGVIQKVQFIKAVYASLDICYPLTNIKSEFIREINVINTVGFGENNDKINDLFWLMQSKCISPYVIIHILLRLNINLTSLENDYYWSKFLPENQL